MGVGGRSSMSFIKEGRWDKALALKADYYLIQFGHNDQPGKPGRSTDANTDYRAYMTRYVDEARAIGAKPVLVTSLVRREFDKNDPHKINSSLEPYVQVVKQMASQKNVPLIDLHARSKTLCESLGQEKCLEFSPSTVRDGKTNFDGTHLNAKGGVLMARLVVDELCKVVPELATCLRNEPGPITPPKTYDVEDFGAKGDGKTFDTAAIQHALDVCGQAGGGIVRLTPGTYLCKPIFLRCNTTLHLDAGATVQATDNPEDFVDSGHSGALLALVNANGLNAVAISGNGTIDGAGKRWWDEWAAAKRNAHPEPRPYPGLIVFSNCVDLKYEDVTLQNSPGAHLVPVDCENISISGTVIQSPKDAPTTDGISLGASRYVTIHDCLIDVGGDNIVIQSDHPDITHPNTASEHITIKDCGFLHGQGISIGSEIIGGVQDLEVSKCMFKGTAGGIRIKSARGRGGPVENVLYQNLTMNDVDYPICLTSYYPEVPTDDVAQPVAVSFPVYHNIVIRNVTSHGANAAGMIVGLPEAPVKNVELDNVHITAIKGMNLRNARGIEFRNSTIIAQTGAPLIVETNASATGLESKLKD